MKPDVIAVWPIDCEYPLWRRFIAEKRELFARVIVALTPRACDQMYIEFVQRELGKLNVISFITKYDPRRSDWRDAATNQALHLSDAEWVWFTEQDFFITQPYFWRAVVELEVSGGNVIGVRADQRWHPCCLFARRDVIDRTRRYFGPDPIDHFYSFGEDLAAAGAQFRDIDAWIAPSYTHMAGLSHNHHLVAEGKPVTYKPDEFAEYLERCLISGVELHPRWKSEAVDWLTCYYETADG